MTEKNKYYVFFNVLRFEEYIVYVKVRYEYVENIKLSIYHPTPQSFCLIF